ncbi:MAG: hypothetical protein K1X55_10320 [Chitinophagales bacterium]|nr:hypothetical protein [Chitinophagales bacterium]
MINILIIEDKPQAREALIDVIRKSNYSNKCNIDYAETYEECENKLLDGTIDYHLIFWDIKLDGGITCYEFWEYFPLSSFIFIFSEEEDVFEKITTKFKGIDKPNIKILKRDTKKEINSKADNGSLAIIKDKLDVFRPQGIASIHNFIERAINRFDSDFVNFVNWETRKESILEISIVMITTIIPSYFYLVDEKGFELKDVKALIGTRKIILLKDRLYISNDPRDGRSLENYILNKLNTTKDFFVKINQSIILNVHHIQRIVEHGKDIEFYMNLSKNIASSEFENKRRLYYENPSNIFKIPKENDSVIKQIRMIRPELFVQ